jgi:hypothetical protein
MGSLQRDGTWCSEEAANARGAKGPVVYLYATDNSSRSQCGKIASFHLHERRGRHETEPIILPTPTGYACVALPPHPCLVVRPSMSRIPDAPQTG